MEKDNWKKKINENRESFEQEEPGTHVWENIEKEFNRRSPRMVKLSTVLQYAAAAAIVVTVSLMWILSKTPEENPTAKVRSQTETEYVLASLSPEYAEMENYYVTRINSAMGELKTFEPDPEMMQAINDLDDEFKRLKKEMGDQVNQSEIIEAMIENYRLKLDLLEQMLDALSEENHSEEPDQELKSV